MVKYTVEEIIHNIQVLQNKLVNKGRDKGFWVIATRSDFRPLKKITGSCIKKKSETVVKISDIKEFLLNGKEKYFIGKKFAFIELEFNWSLLNLPIEQIEKDYNKLKNEYVCKLSIVIHNINDNGKFSNKWMCIINFTLDDLSKYKLTYRDIEIFMRQIADKLVLSNNMIGISYQNYINAIKKK
jgi:hypothetical protein